MERRNEKKYGWHNLFTKNEGKWLLNVSHERSPNQNVIAFENYSIYVPDLIELFFYCGALFNQTSASKTLIEILIHLLAIKYAPMETLTGQSFCRIPLCSMHWMSARNHSLIFFMNRRVGSIRNDPGIESFLGFDLMKKDVWRKQKKMCLREKIIADATGFHRF